MPLSRGPAEQQALQRGASLAAALRLLSELDDQFSDPIIDAQVVRLEHDAADDPLPLCLELAAAAGAHAVLMLAEVDGDSGDRLVVRKEAAVPLDLYLPGQGALELHRQHLQEGAQV